MTRRLVARPLDARTFAPFGTVIEVPVAAAGRPINAGSSERFDLVDDLALDAAGGRGAIAVFRAQARRFPFTLIELERHALGSQSFLPLGVARFVLVVAPAGKPPAPDALTAFVTHGRQGVVLAPGTWHHALLAVEAGDFAVIERAAAQVDCECHHLKEAVDLRLDAS
ncbi:ureidoglycolate lyase [Ottowia sp.]|uniref:ureidoglycolate lyase n=1 Tax=Ottowia sp. TaxID=1898956 RepID=UPI00262325D3|nr:ureidoglycolate lyase [Ottowia sp.]